MQHCREVWGHAPPGIFWNSDHMRVLLSLSETTITMPKFMAHNVTNSWFGHFLEPLPFGISLCIWSTATELSFESCRFECFMFAGHEAVIGVATCAERTVNLRTHSVPKGEAPPPPPGSAPGGRLPTKHEKMILTYKLKKTVVDDSCKVLCPPAQIMPATWLHTPHDPHTCTLHDSHTCTSSHMYSLTFTLTHDPHKCTSSHMHNLTHALLTHTLSHAHPLTCTPSLMHRHNSEAPSPQACGNRGRDGDVHLYPRLPTGLPHTHNEQCPSDHQPKAEGQ